MTTPLDGKAKYWKRRALKAEASLREERDPNKYCTMKVPIGSAHAVQPGEMVYVNVKTGRVI